MKIQTKTFEDKYLFEIERALNRFLETIPPGDVISLAPIPRPESWGLILVYTQREDDRALAIQEAEAIFSGEMPPEIADHNPQVCLESYNQGFSDGVTATLKGHGSLG